MNHTQVLFDDPLLRCLDADPEVRKPGRSELRRAALNGSKGSRLRPIRKSSRRPYGNTSGLGSDFAGWEGEGKWPQGIGRGESWRFRFSRPVKTRPILDLSK